MELARYAPEEVDKDERKHDMFKEGLNQELRTLLTSDIPRLQHSDEQGHSHRKGQSGRKKG